MKTLELARLAMGLGQLICPKPLHRAATGTTPIGERLEASIATAVWAWRHGAVMVRVHDVAATIVARSLTAPDSVSDTAA